jgi:soluble lytic murein transglycosylase
VLAILLVGIGFWIFRERHVEQRAGRYEDLIASASARYGVDPALIKAVVWCESRYDGNARGRVGEIGLMQLREAAAWEWASAERIRNFDHEHVADPKTNLLAGTWYLSRLLGRYQNVDDPIPFALADYNAGRSHVLRWNHGAGSTNSAVFMEQITYPGTRRYIEMVIDRREFYR